MCFIFLLNAKGYTIIFNITADDVVLKDIRFENGNATGQYAYGVNNGGAIYWTGSNGKITDNCQFTDNYAEYGGAVFVDHSGKNNTINGSVFKDNTAKYNGGGHKYASGVRLKNWIDADNLIKELDEIANDYNKKTNS